MSLNDYTRLTKETILKEIEGKINGLPNYLVDGRYRDRKADVKYMEEILFNHLQDELEIKLNRGAFSMHLDEDTNAIKISFLDSVTNTAEERGKFIKLLEELGYLSYGDKVAEVKRITMEVNVK